MEMLSVFKSARFIRSLIKLSQLRCHVERSETSRFTSFGAASLQNRSEILLPRLRDQNDI